MTDVIGEHSPPFDLCFLLKERRIGSKMIGCRGARRLNMPLRRRFPLLLG
jgi:hypothetical protein